MTSYNDVFGDETVPPSCNAYRSVALSADTTFFWPQLSEGDDLMATIMDVSASGAYTMTLPDATLVSTGQDVLIRNTGANTITINDSAGGTITTITAGTIKYFYLTDNSTAAGSWTGFTFGTGTSGADANGLAGYGMTVVGNTLALEHQTISSSITYAIQASDRAKVVVFSSSGSVTCTVPSAAVVGDGFFFMVSNQGSGTVTVTNGADDVDGSSTKAVAPTESLLLVTDGSAWYSVGYGRGTTFAFTQLVKDVTAGGSFTLSASEYANKLMRFIGTPTSDVTIVVPAVANVYYVQCAYTGTSSLTMKTSLGTGLVMTASDRVIVLCDGVDVLLAQDASVATPTSVPDGSAASPSLFFASDANTGFYRAAADSFGIAGGGTALAVFSTAGFNVPGSAKRITGDFSNATQSDRVLFQSSTTNGATNLGAIPNGTSQVVYFTGYGGTDPANASFVQIGCDAASGVVWLGSYKNGSGTYLPLAFYVNGAERLRLTTDNRLQADFDNAASGSRLLLQTKKTDTSTNVGVIPNGAATDALWSAFNSSSPGNASAAQIGVSATAAYIKSYKMGSGTYLPLAVNVSGSDVARWETDGRFSYKNYSLFRAHVVSGQTSSTTGNPVTFDSLTGSSDYSTSSHTATVPKTGWYNVVSNVEIIDTSGSPRTMVLYLNVNGSRLITRSVSIAASGVGIFTFVTRRRFTAGHTAFVEWGGSYLNFEVVASSSEFSWEYAGD